MIEGIYVNNIWHFFPGPLPVTGFVATRSPQSMTSVELNWSPGQNSNQDVYTITYTGEIVKKTTQTITAVESPKVVSGLFPGERYKFIIKAKSSDKLSDPQDGTVAVCKYIVMCIRVFIFLCFPFSRSPKAGQVTRKYISRVFYFHLQNRDFCHYFVSINMWIFHYILIMYSGILWQTPERHPSWWCIVLIKIIFENFCSDFFANFRHLIDWWLSYFT